MGVASQFRVETPGAGIAAEADCGHYHAPDPAQLGAGFSWRGAAATVVAAGARPCSGAIVVLTFALTQGLFAAGDRSRLSRWRSARRSPPARSPASRSSPRTPPCGWPRANPRERRLIARGLELAAALCVLAYGACAAVRADRRRVKTPTSASKLGAMGRIWAPWTVQASARPGSFRHFTRRRLAQALLGYGNGQGESAVASTPVSGSNMSTGRKHVRTNT